MTAQGMSHETPLLVVVMGVAGSGKTTVGTLLAERLGVEFGDADDFHSAANKEKMRAGIPLNDDDRWPWLEAVGEWLDARSESGAVATCSALKRRYRDALRRHAPDLILLHLYGTPDLVTERASTRHHEYMPPSLVGSQFDTLEPPDSDERAVSIDVAATPDEIVTDFLAAVEVRRGTPTGE